MKDVIKMFYDVETTGVDPKKHAIHQLAAIMEVNGEVVDEFNLNIKPLPDAIIEPEALKIGGVTEAQIMQYPICLQAHTAIRNKCKKYIDLYDKTDKVHLIGYNNRSFDDLFLRVLFERCGDKYIGSYFFNDTIDVLVLASQYLIDIRPTMPSFKLERVAKTLGIEVDGSKLHDALYDVRLTRACYRVITGLDCEI